MNNISANVFSGIAIALSLISLIYTIFCNKKNNRIALSNRRKELLVSIEEYIDAINNYKTNVSELPKVDIYDAKCLFGKKIGIQIIELYTLGITVEKLLSSPISGLSKEEQNEIDTARHHLNSLMDSIKKSIYKKYFFGLHK